VRTLFDTVLQDLRIGARLLRNRPGFAAVTVVTLALAVGANTAIFSVVDAVVLRPLAFSDADRLYAVHEVVPKLSSVAPVLPVNGGHFREWQRTTRSFDQLALLGGTSLTLTGAGEPERLPAARVTPNLFPMLGGRTQLGRTFLDEEDQPGRDRVVILNDELWRRRFGADPRVIGRTITLDDGPYEIVGVLAAGFRFPQLRHLFAMTVSAERPQIWKPIALSGEELNLWAGYGFACLARTQPGATAAAALAELNQVQASLASRSPQPIELLAALVPLQDQITGRSRSGLQLLLAAVGVVFLIGCVNVANLLLARTSSRGREFGIRSALGASRARLVQQMLVENLLLSAVAGVLGIAIAYATLPAILAYAPADVPRLDEVRIDGRVLLFALAGSLLAGVVINLLPAWRFGRADRPAARDAIAAGSRHTAAPRAARVRSVLVGLEVALCALSLVASGLLLHSFVRLIRIDRGFEAERVVTVDMTLPARYASRDKKTAFLRSAVERLASLPGVASAGIASSLPLSGSGGNTYLFAEGTQAPLMERPAGDYRQVSPDYFRTMGIPLRSGRVFAASDGDRPVAVVSALTAARLWPAQNPVGRRFRIANERTPLLEVVGIVGDVRSAGLEKTPALTVYVPFWQRFFNQASFVVKTSTDSVAAVSLIRAVLHELDPELPVPAFRTMEEVVANSITERRFQMNLMLLFGATAALLACLGIFAVVSYSVAQRTSEMGIRLALGAQPAQIRWLVRRQGLAPVAIGLGTGLVASMAMRRILGGMLFGIEATDPWTLGAVVAVIAAVAAVATHLPARRASRMDPMLALRDE
jgi:putative ABC transport system permease protein